MFQCVRTLLAVAALLVGVQAALAADRVALVIGNGDYSDTTKLANPVNDASDIAAKLRDLGFIVVEGENLGKRDMEQKIGEFSDQLEGSEAAVFYYAGHGISVGGRNFVVPVDAHLNAPAKLKFESISIDDVVELMRQQSEVNILILDACRNNPFARGNGTSTRGVAEPSGGLAAVSSYSGAYTVYSAQDGAVALDGDGRNSPFAIALLKHLGTPGAGVESIMGAVKAEVETVTNGFQSPDAKGLLVRSFSFNPRQALQKQVTRSATPDEPIGQGIAEQSRIRQFIESEYLDPDVKNLEATLARIYMPEVNVFGTFANQKELYLLKKGFFDQFERWELGLYPGSLEISFKDAGNARVVFVLSYVYWPKSTPEQPAKGNFKAVLDLIEKNGRWMIVSEAADP